MQNRSHSSFTTKVHRSQWNDTASLSPATDCKPRDSRAFIPFLARDPISISLLWKFCIIICISQVELHRASGTML